MPARQHNKNSELFLLRVWREEEAEGAKRWRGRLQHAASGAQRQFRTLDELADLLDTLLGVAVTERSALSGKEDDTL